MKTFLIVAAVFAMATLALAQRRPPNYAQDTMPDTSFNCRDKVVGGYYADPETDCQMFHVCVKVPGIGVQDFRFLCPNDTTFDQENQICANWYDIDCEASTLFYSDNFDLYRLDSGKSNAKNVALPLGPSTQRPPAALPKARAPIRDDDEEEEFYLQRSETGDRRLQKDLLRGSSSGNFFNKRRGQEDDDDDDVEAKPEKKPVVQGNGRRGPDGKKVAVRKQVRKRPEQQTDAAPTSTDAPASPSSPNYVNRQNNRQHSRLPSTTEYEPQKAVTTSRPYQPRYNTVNRQGQSTTTSTTTDAPEAIQATIAAFQSRNNRPRYNSQRNFVSRSTTTLAPTTRQAETTPIFDNTPRGFEVQKIVTNGAGFSSTPSFNRPSQEFSTSNALPTTFAPTTYNGNYRQGNFGKSSTSRPEFTDFNNNNNNNNNFNSRPSTANPERQNFNNFNAKSSTANSDRQNFNNGSPSTSSPRQSFNTNNSPSFNNNPSSNAPNRQSFNNFNNNPSTSAPNRQSFNNFNNNPSTSTPNRQSFNNNPSTSAPNRQSFNNFNNNPSTSAPNRQSFNTFNASPSTARPQQQQRDYQDYNGAFDSYGNQRNNDNSDEFIDSAQGEEEFLKTAPSNNIRPSGLNNFAKTQQKDEAAGKRLTTVKQYYTPTTERAATTTTSYYHPSSVQPSSYQPSTYQPTSYQPSSYQPTFSSTNPPRPKEPVKTTKKATEAKLNNDKAKDVSYDYAYYDDTEYEGADPISDHHFGKAGESQKIRN